MARKRKKKIVPKEVVEPVLDEKPVAEKPMPQTVEEKLLMVYSEAPEGPMDIDDKSAWKATPMPQTVEEKLLMVYSEAPEGPMDIDEVMKATGESKENLSIAWDRLYDKHQLPFGKFVKHA